MATIEAIPVLIAAGLLGVQYFLSGKMAKTSGIDAARMDLKDILRKQGRVTSKLQTNNDSETIEMLRRQIEQMNTRGMPSVDLKNIDEDFLGVCKKLTALLKRLFDITAPGDKLTNSEIDRVQNVLGLLDNLGLLKGNGAEQTARQWTEHVDQLGKTYLRTPAEKDVYLDNSIAPEMAKLIRASTLLHDHSFKVIKNLSTSAMKTFQKATQFVDAKIAALPAGDPVRIALEELRRQLETLQNNLRTASRTLGGKHKGGAGELVLWDPSSNGVVQYSEIGRSAWLDSYAVSYSVIEASAGIFDVLMDIDLQVRTSDTSTQTGDEDQVRRLIQENQKCNEEKAQLQLQLREAAQQASDDLSGLDRQLAEAQTQLAAARADVEQLKKDQASDAQRVRSAEAEVQRLEARVEELQGEIQTKTNASGAADAMRGEIARLGTELTE